MQFAGGMFDADENDHSNWVVIKVVFGTALVIAFPIVAWFGGWHIRQGLASHSWPEIQGVITQTTTEQIRRTRQLPHHRLRVGYRYEVNGQAFTGSQLVGAEMTTLESLEPVKQLYPAGGKLPVYYAPGHPDYSLLVRGGNWLWTTIGVGMLGVIAIGGGVSAWKNGHILRQRLGQPAKKATAKKTKGGGTKVKRRAMKPLELDE